TGAAPTLFLPGRGHFARTFRPIAKGAGSLPSFSPWAVWWHVVPGIDVRSPATSRLGRAGSRRRGQRSFGGFGWQRGWRSQSAHNRFGEALGPLSARRAAERGARAALKPVVLELPAELASARRRTRRPSGRRRAQGWVLRAVPGCGGGAA